MGPLPARCSSAPPGGSTTTWTAWRSSCGSFLSYPRHEYFRRILCRVIGGWVADGQAPADYELLGAMVQDICFHNVANFIGIQG